MSETCIVCLGDLGAGSGEVPALSLALARSPIQERDERPASTDVLPAPTINVTDDDSGLIAHLQPCGHNLHNDCLTPWVERANSCPICRQSFYSVELSNKIGGDVISSYTVEDRTQVADLDPSIFLEVPDEDLDPQPCQVCGEDDNEDVLMYCDGCQKLWHTYCVDLQEVPYGHWFCENCRAQRELNPRYTRAGTSRFSHRPRNRRTRGQQRRYRNRVEGVDSNWTQVWQTVWDRINLDLDFPYDDEESAATAIRRHRQQAETSRREHEAWQRRVRVAELSGAGGRFRETTSSLLDHGQSTLAGRRRNRTATPEAQSTDETLAWHAFDQARRAETDRPAFRKKKRKSPSTSPVEQEPTAAERPTKRLRKRVGHDTREASDSGESTSIIRPSPRLPSPRIRRPLPSNSAVGPSFLQSLLKEVEDSSTPAQGSVVNRPTITSAFSPPVEHSSPQPSSPALSPLPSNHSSPRAMSATPPPHAHVRPTSPTGLSSSIQPVFLSDFSPSRSSPEPQSTSSEPQLPNSSLNRCCKPIKVTEPAPQKRRIPRVLQNSSSSPSRARSNETSPIQTTLTFNAKNDVQKMVSAALKPHYDGQTISKDEYTSINRDISRKLYDEIGDFEALDVEGKAKWEKIAGDEVRRAIGALRMVAVSNGHS